MLLAVWLCRSALRRTYTHHSLLSVSDTEGGTSLPLLLCLLTSNRQSSGAFRFRAVPSLSLAFAPASSATSIPSPGVCYHPRCLDLFLPSLSFSPVSTQSYALGVTLEEVILLLSFSDPEFNCRGPGSVPSARNPRVRITTDCFEQHNCPLRPLVWSA